VHIRNKINWNDIKLGIGLIFIGVASLLFFLGSVLIFFNWIIGIIFLGLIAIMFWIGARLWHSASKKKKSSD